MQTSDREFTVDIARAIVTPVDPQMLTYLEADAEAYFADPREALATGRKSTELGSGVEVAVGVTAVALYVAQAALDVVLEESIKKGVDGIRGFLNRRRKPGNELAGRPDVPTFTDEQIDLAAAAVTAVARGRGLDAAAATTLATAVRDRLPRKPAPPSGD
ncbi:hypothetical protein Aph02nite_39060 [Actinoplanes philippinensis]|uniref:Uncharacterized protein n=1 Tax=Actinoplanes philippinensis TaxID=35752 RepID=A0A1I2GQ18_9ACTN|nr:hypothetical protein [Actinoplanes philippinensis]GIE77956.1 hypothetical protein Aph02nite_39060 [Actinoplanes philippinensis]SFF19120.1 hypothetical protein SAMN05421541_10741 [Actinoplanes philippinensis]